MVDITSSGIPMYQMVKSYVLELIKNEQWSESRKLPSENDLVNKLSVSRMTVNRALRELVTEGYIERVSGVGTFASEPKSASHPLEIKNIAEEILSRGHIHTCEVIELGEVRASPTEAMHFSIAPGSRLLHSTIKHLESGTIVQIEDRFVLPSFAPDYLTANFVETTTSTYLFKITSSIQQVEQIISAELSTKKIRTLLELTESEPTLLLTRKIWVENEVVTYSHLYHPAKYFQFVSKYKP